MFLSFALTTRFLLDCTRAIEKVCNLIMNSSLCDEKSSDKGIF
jgi:hypothetical protein